MKLIKRIGLQIRKERKAKGLTLMNLSDITGLSYQFISKVETGQQDVRISTLEKFSKALNVEFMI